MAREVVVEGSVGATIAVFIQFDASDLAVLAIDPLVYAAVPIAVDDSVGSRSDGSGGDARSGLGVRGRKPRLLRRRYGFGGALEGSEFVGNRER